MTGAILAKHEFSDADAGDGNLLVSRPRRGSDYQLVFDGPAGLETAIPFDGVDVDGVTITFYRRPGHSALIESGSIENCLDAWGAVGEWLRDHATPEATV